MMSVGRSGVGKSTIGNMFLFGEGEGGFSTSWGSESCTHGVKELRSEGGDCAYIDVPGLPDTNPNNTAKFYDVIVKEAKKELNVILFVFKRDRIDPASYKLAELLFRELNKANAAKILVINDYNNYKFKKPPTEDEYSSQVETIKKMTRIDFTSSLVFTGETMKEKLQQLKNIMSKAESYKSEHLKNFNELKKYVDGLREKKNYIEEVVIQQKQRIFLLQRSITTLKGIMIGSTILASASSVIGLFTFGATMPITVAAAANTGAAMAMLMRRRAELERAIEMIKTEDLTVASRDLEKACEKFNELKEALDAN